LKIQLKGDTGMENGLGYIRVSTKGQAKDGYSLDQQRDEIERFCKDQDIHLVDIFSDEVSGAKDDEESLEVLRDGYLDMIERAKAGDIKLVVVLTTNRLWRSDLTKAIVHRDLKRLNMDIKAVDRPRYSIYENDPNAMLTNGIFELIDIFERGEITNKLRRGRKKKASLWGYSGGRPPYGYKATRGGKQLVIDEAEAEAVRAVFALRRCEWYTLQNIADKMNAQGMKGRNDKAFNHMLVKRILAKEAFYKGEYSYSGITTTGVHTPIL
jgi:DNA invertase Pin-like site-specific DNA recombinase